MRRIFILFIICFSLSFNITYALDWIQLHEKADNTELSSALSSVKSNPQSIPDLYVLGLIYIDMHRTDEAQDVFEKILSLDPDNTGGKWGKAEVLRRKYQIIRSEKMLNEIIEESPEFSAAYISLAYIKYTQRKFEEATRLAIKVMDQGQENVDESNYVRARLIYAGTKGMIAHFGGPVSKVVNGSAVMPSLQAAQRIKPDSAQVKFGLGSFYLLAPGALGGDTEKAKQYLEDAIDTDPLLVDAYVRLAQVYKLENNEEMYEKYLQKALSIDPKNVLARDVKSGRCNFICI